ncbi:hypothetical protein [Streptomyces sp. NPDC049879]|uniref:hypothetical protein n=1 Tax=Streptomyces sp. NPDC049879 TaxID=3365598 RepID=UPI0037A3019D
MGFLKRLTLAASSAAVLATGLAASPASAAPVYQCVTVWSEDGGTALGEACFYHYGDMVTVRDLYAGGARAVGVWKTNYGRSGECHNAYGANDRTVSCNYNMKETGIVTLSVCVREGANGKNLLCSGSRSIHIGTGERV